MEQKQYVVVCVCVCVRVCVNWFWLACIKEYVIVSVRLSKDKLKHCEFKITAAVTAKTEGYLASYLSNLKLKMFVKHTDQTGFNNT